MYIYIITNCQGENVNLKVVLEFIGIILSKKLDQMHTFPLKTSKTLIQNLEFDLKMIHNWTYLAFPQSDSRWKMLPIHWAVESERLFPGESFFKDTPEDVKSPQVRGPFIPVATMESVVFLAAWADCNPAWKLFLSTWLIPKEQRRGCQKSSTFPHGFA